MVNYTHINLGELEQIAQGDRGFILRMLQACCDSAPQLIIKLKAGLRDGNREEIRSVAHRLRPCFHYMGRPDLAQMLEEIEKGTYESNPGKLQEHCETFFAEADLLLREASEALTDYAR